MPPNARAAARPRATDDASPRRSEPSPLGAGLSVGTILGVRVHADWSLLIIFALVLVNLGAGVLPAWHPDWSAALTWGTALGASVLFFASLLAHELSHAVVARRNDIPVSRITLFLFGGLAHMESEPPSAKSEFRMAIVGPLTSIVIGAAAIGLGSALAGADFRSTFHDDPQAAMQGLGPLASLLLWLGPINVLIGLFNVIPGFPLDGGRVLRSILWWTTGDLRKATRWATTGGRVFAWVLMAWGVMNLVGGLLVQGMWLLLIGWFLHGAARMSYEQLLVREGLRGVPLERLMRTRFATVEPDTTVERLVREELMAADQRAFPVVERGGELLGLVCLEDLRGVPQERWDATPVSEIMTRTDALRTLTPADTAQQAFELLARREIDQVPVLDGRRPVGLVRRQDILKWLALRSEEIELESALRGA